MMRPAAADQSTAELSVSSHPPPRSPSSLDRLLDRVQRGTPRLNQVSDRLLVGITALLAAVDIAVWATDPVVDTGRLPTSTAIAVPCLGVFATFAVALRRRHLCWAVVMPATASIVLTSAAWSVGSSLPPSFAALFAVALATTGVLRREPGGTAVLLATLAAVAVGAESLRPMVGPAAYLLIACETSLGIAAGVGIYLRWVDWRRVAAERSARADERLAIARELHDLVGHYVTGMVVQAQAARHVADRRPADVAVALERIETAGGDAMLAMRRMVRGLRDDAPTAPTSTWHDVDRLVADAIAHGAPVRATIDPEVRGLAPALAPSVHRIVAESVTNVGRHARNATCIDVAVVVRAGRLVVSVRDDGNDVIVPGGGDTFGIVGMRERATALGGSLSAGPAPDGGWLVHAELPMEHAR